MDDRCYYCDRVMSRGRFSEKRRTVDHKLPLCRGGRHNEDNLVWCCWRCNNVKGAMTEDEFNARWPDKSLLPVPQAQPVYAIQDGPKKQVAVRFRWI